MDNIDDVASSLARRSIGRGISISIALHAFILMAVALLPSKRFLDVPPPATLIELVKEEPAEAVQLKPQERDVPARAPDGSGAHPQIQQSPAILVARALEKHGTQAIESVGSGQRR